jgi:predicted RNA-binding protein with PUA-like domain
MAYWLMKSEPDVYGIQHLQQEGSTLWDGIRNYQARNFMRSMAIGDQAFFYHSNAKPPGIVGLMEVVELGITDPSQFDPNNKYFDPKSTPDKPRWDCVRLSYVGTFKSLLSLEALRDQFSVDELPVVRQGNRLSILPVPEASAQRLLELLGPL